MPAVVENSEIQRSHSEGGTGKANCRILGWLKAASQWSDHFRQIRLLASLTGSLCEPLSPPTAGDSDSLGLLLCCPWVSLGMLSSSPVLWFRESKAQVYEEEWRGLWVGWIQAPGRPLFPRGGWCKWKILPGIFLYYEDRKLFLIEQKWGPNSRKIRS